MNKAKISIIATFYNLEDYTKRCVDSLTSQTFQDIEIICINDGSTDNTIGVLQDLALNDNRIKIIDKKNEGVSIARNTGINAASGEYIMFVDGDDYLEPNACEILYKKVKEYYVDIITYQFTNKWTNKSIKDKKLKISPYYLEIKDHPYLFSDKLEKTYKSINLGICWDKLYKRDFIIKNKISFPESLNLYEDAIFILKILITNPQILVTDYFLYNYWKSRNTSLTKVNKYSFFLKTLDAINYTNNIFDNKNYKKDNIVRLHFINNMLIHFLLQCSWLYSNNKQEYISSILEIMENYKDFDKKTVEKMNGYKRARKYLLLDKYNLLGVYLSIIRPVGKYCLVRPYRLFRELINELTLNIFAHKEIADRLTDRSNKLSYIYNYKILFVNKNIFISKAANMA